MSVQQITDSDTQTINELMSQMPDTESVAGFVEGPGITKLQLSFDIEKLREALSDALSHTEFKGDLTAGFGAFSLTRRPGVEVETPNDLSGLFFTRVDDSYEEVRREEVVDEFKFTELVPAFQGTYFEHVHNELTKRFPIGRMRVLSKGLYNCNSWHRDPEPRLHIPIVTNPGSLFIVNHHVTHLPADGSVYFTDTRGYHTALNGGESNRVHIVAALPWKGAPT
ncbi:MAG: hypothetical protein AAGF54_11625 [Pseudomonadota bacterium]